MSEDAKPETAVEVIDKVEPLIRSLPQEKRTALRQIITSIQFQGPLPPPAMMEDYDRIIPNGANRLVVLSEKQTAHRIAMEEILVTGRVIVTKRGQLFATGLSVFSGWWQRSLGTPTMIGLPAVSE